MMNSGLQRPFRLEYSVECLHTYPIRPKTPLSKVKFFFQNCLPKIPL